MFIVLDIHSWCLQIYSPPFSLLPYTLGDLHLKSISSWAPLTSCLQLNLADSQSQRKELGRWEEREIRYIFPGLPPCQATVWQQLCDSSKATASIQQLCSMATALDILLTSPLLPTPTALSVHEDAMTVYYC